MPDSQAVQHYGVTERFVADGPYARAVEEIHYTGYTILHDVLKPNEISSLSAAIDRIYDVQMEELGGVAIAESIQDANNVRCPLAYDEQFVALAKHPAMLGVMRAILGEQFVLMMQNAIINQPVDGNYQTRWHRDLNYQHWVSTKPLSLNALFTIDPFTVETGCTHVLPGTHLRATFPSDDFITRHEVPAVAPAGSLILMDAMLYHRAGYNRSGQVRRGVNHVIGLPFMAQQIDIPSFVGERLAVDDFSRQYFGYRWRPAPDAKSWRMAKVKN